MRNKILVLLYLAALILFLQNCRTELGLAIDKSGAELWGDNCGRCHNTPDPTSYEDEKWETITMHMKIRTNISDKSIALIKEFLQSANGD